MNSKNKSIYKVLPLAFFFLTMTLLSCVQKTETQEPHHEEASSTVVNLTADQQKAIGIQSDTITHRNLSSTLKVNGKVEVPPQNKAEVNVLTGGIVRTINIKEGEFVHSGQTLATMENLEFIQLQQDYLSNKSGLPYLKAEYERQRELQKDNINATKTAQQAESNYNLQLTMIKGLSQKLKLYNIDPDKLTNETIRNSFSVLAPISGHITSIAISIGQYVDPNTSIFQIVDNRYLHIDLSIFEPDIHKIKEKQRLTFSDANDPTHIHTAEIFSINKSFENNQQVVIAHAKILNDVETLLPGMFIEARININQERSATLPDEAIVSNGDDHFIFVTENENQFRQVQVRIGASDLGFTEIIPLETVAEKQKVVVKGAYYLFSQLTKGEGEHHE